MLQFVTITHNRGASHVEVGQIIRVASSSNYCKIYFANAHPLVVAKVLQWFENELPADMFTRVHRSHLINRMYVQTVDKSNPQKLLLLNGEIIMMSRRKKHLLKAG